MPASAARFSARFSKPNLLKAAAAIVLSLNLIDNILAAVLVTAETEFGNSHLHRSSRAESRDRFLNAPNYSANLRSLGLSAVTNSGSLEAVLGMEPPVLAAPGLAAEGISNFARNVAAALLSLKANLQATEVNLAISRGVRLGGA